MNSNWINPSDLAPGDLGCRGFDWTGFEITQIKSTTDPLFSAAYQRLWDEFGTKGEMETEQVLARRMKWDPSVPRNGYSFYYEMILVRKNGRFAAVRDHTAIVNHRGSKPQAFVHLSHVLIDPEHRGQGMIGWLRAWPVAAARTCLKRALGKDGEVTLVGEMEPLLPEYPDRLIRLKSYGKAGFVKVDPRQVSYYQPDFRPPHEIDADGSARPLPLQLVIRRVGRETEKEIHGTEVKEMVAALYEMYGVEFREKDMAVVWKQWNDGALRDSVSIPLVDTVSGDSQK